MSEIYKGNSDSFQFLVGCYLDYANEVICRRALPDLRDGQKKVTRRIIYSAYMNKKPTMQKCIPFVSDAVKLHPHGDQAVYGAFTLMTDENGSCNMPLFEGLGNLGKVYSSKTPADMRYPKARVGKNLEDFFREKDVMKLVPAEEGEGEEPDVLNAIYPIVLVNGTFGIAVSVATRIPSFNFGDVLDLTIKYLEQGSLDVTDVIIPDFPTGGVLVRDDGELAKIMATGKGKLKIRAKVEVEGNQILVKEIPFGRTVESIKYLIDNTGMKEISFCSITVGRNAPALLTIECRSKRVVEYVLMELYRRNILQYPFSSNIVVTENEVPFILGVHKIIERWCNWRESVVVEKCNKIINSAETERNLLKYIKVLIDDVESCVAFAETYVRNGKQAARVFLQNYFKDKFDEVPSDAVEWILKRELSSLSRKATTYLARYESLELRIAEYNRYREHPEEYIIQELKNLKEEKAGQYERKTAVTYSDYKFSRSSNEEIVDDSWCVWTLRRDGFLMKSKDYRRGTLPLDSDGKDPILYEFEGFANSVLIGFDNYGRILRVQGKDVPYTGNRENGFYLPRYFDMGSDSYYKVLYMGILDGKTRTLIYQDGYVGFFDTSEFVDRKNIVKIVTSGVNKYVGTELLEVYEEDNTPEYIMLADDSGDEIMAGIISMYDITVKGRLGRCKAFPGKVHASYIREMTFSDLYSYIKNPDPYVGYYVPISADYFTGDPTELRDGKYLGICKEVE